MEILESACLSGRFLMQVPIAGTRPQSPDIAEALRTSHRGAPVVGAGGPTRAAGKSPVSLHTDVRP
jgi:hypothetical protein